MNACLHSPGLTLDREMLIYRPLLVFDLGIRISRREISMYQAIVAGTDGSEKAQEAVERALDIAEDYDAALHVITIVNTRRYGEPALSSTEMILNELEDRGNKQLKEVSEQGSERGIQTVTKCFHGHPSEEIINYADEHNAGLIVLGSHGHTHPRSVIGSTAERVLHDTDREVLIV